MKSSQKITIAVVVVVIAFSVLYLAQREQSESVNYESSTFSDDLKVASLVDSAVNASKKKHAYDTTGLSNAPVKVLSAKFTQNEYSSYRDITVSYRNVSQKRIDAIRFKWYGENAFGEPADMGGVIDGFGGGNTDNPVSPGRTESGTWSIHSRDGKRIVICYPAEVVFSDGTKWDIEKSVSP